MALDEEAVGTKWSAGVTSFERSRLTEQLRRVRGRLKTAEQELRRIASENARLVTENSLLRVRVSSRKVLSLNMVARTTRSRSPA